MAGASRRSPSGVSSCTEITFTKSADGKSAAKTRRARCGQHVIGTGGVIAAGFGTVRTDEHAARVPDLRKQAGIVDRQMLRRKLVGCFHGRIHRRA